MKDLKTFAASLALERAAKSFEIAGRQLLLAAPDTRWVLVHGRLGTGPLRAWLELDAADGLQIDDVLVSTTAQRIRPAREFAATPPQALCWYTRADMLEIVWRYDHWGPWPPLVLDQRSETA